MRQMYLSRTGKITLMTLTIGKKVEKIIEKITDKLKKS